MQSPQLKFSEREIAQAWAKIAIIKWKKKLAINKVGNSGAILKSFQYNCSCIGTRECAENHFAF
jgi:hypothetical protein